MPPTLELPDGAVVTPDDVFLYNDYPYRFRPLDREGVAFVLTPLYWGGGDMDIPFPDRAALVDQWGPGSHGDVSEEEWAAWLRRARRDERFTDAELDAIERELEGTDGLLAAIRRRLGL